MPSEEEFVLDGGITLEQFRENPIVLEQAMTRVRHRHEKAGDTDKLTFGDIVREAREEVEAEYQRLARGEDFTARYSLGRRS
jgi:hypothetical protein